MATAAVAVLVLIGGVALLWTSGSADGPASPASPLDCWETTTTGPSGEIAPCPPAAERDQVARRAALEILGAERFAGLWFEEDGTVLVLGYVGEPTLLSDVPGVNRIVARSMSLAEMEELVRVNNELEGDSGYHWRINIREGVVDREKRGEILRFYGNEDFCGAIVEALESGELTWGELTPEEVKEIGDRCGVGPL